MTESLVKSRKPANTALRQQRLRAWQPIMTPKTVIPSFIIAGVLFISIGIILLVASNSVKEVEVPYVSDDQSVTLIVKEDMAKPVFLYYRFENFYQNHRSYVKSVDYKQLRGEKRTEKDISSTCKPEDSISGKIIYPCGLIAKSYSFVDNFEITEPADLTILDSGITWSSDANRYKRTKYEDSDFRKPSTWGDDLDPKDVVLSERFWVWMRVAALPNFRKVWGKIDSSIKAGTKVEIKITGNRDSTDSSDDFKSFGGKKYISLSTVSWIGGKNPFLGWAYLVTGIVLVFLGISFLALHVRNPRKLGDHAYLSWNQTAEAAAQAQPSPE